MKRTILLLLSLLFTLTACGGHVRSCTVLDWAPSSFYTDAEITDAIEVAKDYFARHFKGCTLKTIGYAGDARADEFAERAIQYDADETIILISSFDVGPSGGDGSLNSNSTYTNWMWILARDAGSGWRHVDHGY